jgi:hypothetical protein
MFHIMLTNCSPETPLATPRAGPTANTDYLVPQAVINNLPIGSIGDYLGLPTGVKANVSVNELPLRAISLIWNEWFRDENLQESYNIDKNTAREYVGDSAISGTNCNNPVLYSSNCLKRAKRKDYFTSALPWPQKGPGVEISLGGSVPLTGDSTNFPLYATANSSVIKPALGVAKGVSGEQLVNMMWNITGSGEQSTSAYIKSDAVKDNFVVDLSAATPISINDLRQAFQIQKLYERDARGGTRYTEILRSHFGVVSPDARLQRPEYLGGGRSRLNINPVMQTSATADGSGTPQGNLSAFGVGIDASHSFTKSFVEHGIIIGFVSVSSDLTYQQGLNRMWSRKGRFDYYWPVFAHLGEQAILNKEIYCQGNATDDEVFGYQERYADYRYYPGIITGQFRSTSPTPLDIWHLAQKFDSLPTLSSQFIEENPPIERVVAVTDEPPFLMDAFFKMKCVRPMPVFATPGLVDHF